MDEQRFSGIQTDPTGRVAMVATLQGEWFLTPTADIEFTPVIFPRRDWSDDTHAHLGSWRADGECFVFVAGPFPPVETPDAWRLYAIEVEAGRRGGTSD